MKTQTTIKKISSNATKLITGGGGDGESGEDSKTKNQSGRCYCRLNNGIQSEYLSYNISHISFCHLMCCKTGWDLAFFEYKINKATLTKGMNCPKKEVDFIRSLGE